VHHIFVPKSASLENQGVLRTFEFFDLVAKQKNLKQLFLKKTVLDCGAILIAGNSLFFKKIQPISVGV
jgi:hypothetical protein